MDREKENRESGLQGAPPESGNLSMKRKIIIITLALAVAVYAGGGCGSESAELDSGPDAVSDGISNEDSPDELSEDEQKEWSAEQSDAWEETQTSEDSVDDGDSTDGEDSGDWSVVTYSEALSDSEAYSDLLDTGTGEYLLSADGFRVGNTEINFSDFTVYDSLCAALGKLNRAAALDVSDAALLVKETGNAAEDFSAEMEERLRLADTDTVSLHFGVEDVADAVIISAVIGDGYELQQVTVTLRGGEQDMENGLILVFHALNLRVINDGPDYSYIWPGEK